MSLFAPPARDTHWLRRAIVICGVVNLAAYALLTFLSFGRLGYVELNPVFREVVRVAPHIPVVGRRVADYLTYRTWLQDSATARTLFYALPLVWLSAAFVFLLHNVRRRASLIDARSLALLCWFAVSFAGINTLAYPRFTGDLWAYVAQGRMFASGHSGYYEPLTAEATEGLGLDPFYERSRMAYGPLWALGGAVASRMTGRHPVLEFSLMKVGLAAVWIATLLLIRFAAAGLSNERKALGLLIFGWMPVSVHQTVAEGHNDVAMVCLVVLWIALVLRGRGALAPFALWASVAVKYASAPLLLVEALRCYVSGMRRVVHATAFLAAGVITAGLFALFWRGPGFFVNSFSMQTWSFFTFADAIATAGRFVGLSAATSHGLGTISRGVVVLPVLYYARSFVMTGSGSRFCELVLAVSCAVLLGASSYVWPWYTLWILAPAALATESAMLRIVVPYALAIPFVQLLWVLKGVDRYRHLTSVLLWILTAAGAVFWRSVRECERPQVEPWSH
jgi:hypothetical protein